MIEHGIPKQARQRIDGKTTILRHRFQTIKQRYTCRGRIEHHPLGQKVKKTNHETTSDHGGNDEGVISESYWNRVHWVRVIDILNILEHSCNEVLYNVILSLEA